MLSRVFTLLLSLILEGGSLAHGAEPNLSAVGGVIDLARWDSSNILPLEGEWAFVANKFLTPRQAFDLAQSASFGALPKAQPGKRFNDLDPSFGRLDQGGGTYLLLLKNISVEELSLMGLQAYSASALYALRGSIGDELRAPDIQMGRPGLSKDEEIPSIVAQNPRQLNIQGSSELIIMIHCSNFHYTWGGMWQPPKIGAPATVGSYHFGQVALQGLVTGALIFMFLYTSSFYLRLPEDKTSLYLSIVILLMIIRNAFASFPSIFSFLSDGIFYELNLKSSHLVVPFSVIFSLYFVKSCFPRQVKPWVSKFFCLVFALPILVIIVADASIYGQLGNIVKNTGIAGAAVIIVLEFRAFRDKENDSGLALTGMFFLIAGTFLEYLETSGVRKIPANSWSYGLLLFLICQAEIVASRFAAAYRKADHLGRSLRDEVERQTREIRSILTHIRQGIFTIEPRGHALGALYSGYTTEILEREFIAGRTIHDVLLDRTTLSSDDKSKIDSAIEAIVDEDVLSFEVNEPCFPREVEYMRQSSEFKTLELDWSPISKVDNTVEKILVSVRDVTEIRRLRNQAQKREDEMSIMVEIVNIPEEKFRRFSAKIDELLMESKLLVSQYEMIPAETNKRLFIIVHTIKGAARTFSFSFLANRAHLVEQKFAQVRTSGVPMVVSDLQLDLDSLRESLNQYRTIGEQRLGWFQHGKSDSSMKPILKQVLEDLVSIDSFRRPHDSSSTINGCVQKIAMLCFDSIESVIEEASRGLDSVARDLGKLPPTIEFPHVKFYARSHVVDILYSIFIHLFRNSMDHGIELPDERVAAGKDPAGKITVAVRKEIDGYRMNFSDDGRGLDLSSVRERAKRLGIIKEDEDLTDEVAANLIFVSGFSTKTVVTDLSGRGVGLDAVKVFCGKIGGTVAITLGELKKSGRIDLTFEVRLPLDTFWCPTDNPDVN